MIKETRAICDRYTADGLAVFPSGLAFTVNNLTNIYGIYFIAFKKFKIALFDSNRKLNKHTSVAKVKNA